MSNSDRKKRVADLASIYNRALRTLRDKHKAEFRKILQDEQNAAGLTVRRRRTSDEVLADKLAEARALLAENG